MKILSAFNLGYFSSKNPEIYILLNSETISFLLNNNLYELKESILKEYEESIFLL